MAIGKKIVIAFFVAVPLSVLLAPMPRFRQPLSTVVEAADGSLLGARIADDGQWRFPAPDSIPHRFVKALVTYEDKYFMLHPGVNPVSLARAAIMNIRSGRIISGGSTLTMQVARLAGSDPRRTYLRKMVEILSALKLELFYSKKEILTLYCANAPFGSNVVGLEAAVWKYSGFSPSEMSWADAATYAVLPNAPSLIYPGKNRELLQTKRDRLLETMCRQGFFDSLTLSLALEEPVLPGVHPLPADARHLTDRYHTSFRGKRIRTTIDAGLQKKITAIVNRHSADLEKNLIHNVACIIISVRNGEVLSYVGNSSPDTTDSHGRHVDIIKAARSTGSILKPLLYAGLLTSGDMLPGTLLPDIPIRFPGFAPKNFDMSFSGAVPASLALSRSLNIPAVKMLQQYTPAHFSILLRRTGITTFTGTPDHYGLSMILGGGEASLWELSGMYASMARVLNRYNASGHYSANDYHPPLLIADDTLSYPFRNDAEPPLSAGALWLTFNALREVNRPDSEMGWQFTGSSPDIAWKTGTSFGFRDAWAIATTPGIVVGVWAGNADGEGRPGLTGVSAAGPVLFEIMALMSPSGWFARPGSDELTLAEICGSSGYRAGPDCPDRVMTWIPVAGLKTDACPWHRTISLNKSRTLRISSQCADAQDIVNEVWFVLPPAMEYFYKKRNPLYCTLPPVAPGCEPADGIPGMEFIYPPPGTSIFIPRDHTGEPTRFVAELVHRNPMARVYWHLDDTYLGETRFIHQFEIIADTGYHRLTAVDENGYVLIAGFQITG